MGGAIRLEGSPDEDQLKSTKAQFYCERADSLQLFFSVLGTKKIPFPLITLPKIVQIRTLHKPRCFQT